MQRKLQLWEKDFIYLAYPLFKNPEIASHLNIAPSTVSNIGITKFKLNKYFQSIKIGDIYNDVQVLSKTKKYQNKNAVLCLCKCGKKRHIRVDELIMYYDTLCRCKIKPIINIQDIIDDYNNYKSLRKIATKYQIHIRTILTILRNNNIKIRSKSYYFDLGIAPNYTGYKDITGTLWGNVRRGAEKRNLEFSISKKYAQKILEQQNYKCALTDEKLFPDLQNKRNSGNMSLDRIDSSNGYVEGNIQWITKDIQKMKMDFEQSKFIALAKKISEKFKNE